MGTLPYPDVYCRWLREVCDLNNVHHMVEETGISQEEWFAPIKR